MGSEFHRTRHNVGFAVCRLFATDYLPKMSADDTEWKWKVSKSNKCSLLQTTIHFSQKTELGLDLVDHISDRAMQKTLTQGVPFPHIRLALSLPLTYMNNSGQSVALYTKQNNFRLKNPGSKNHMDEVLVVEPSYVSYIPCVELCGGIPVSIPLQAKNRFRLILPRCPEG